MANHLPARSRQNDLHQLGRLKPLAWLSSSQLRQLGDAMTFRDIDEGDVIYHERGRTADDTYVLLSGAAEILHIANGHTRTVSIVPPGLIQKFPLMPMEIGHNFRCMALKQSRIGKLPTERFVEVTLGARYQDFLKISDSTLSYLGPLLARYPSFVGFSLLQRVAVALLELSHGDNADGVMLQHNPTHRQLADLVGASRPKVTQVLKELESRKALVRDGRRLILFPLLIKSLVPSPAAKNGEH